MTLRHIKIFLAVYQHESITRAAEQLHMTQPAVSRAVQELESYYGVRLFDRLGRRLSVTSCGRDFYEHAVHITDTFDQMERGLKNWDEVGVLRIGASITLGNTLLPAVLPAFQAQHPKLRVQAQVRNGQSLLDALAANTLDFCLLEGALPGEALVREPLLEDELLLIVPPRHDLTRRKTVQLADLPVWPMLLREEGSAGRSFVDLTFTSRGLLVQPVWECASTQAIVKAVHAGLGISLLPRALVQSAIESGFVATCAICDASFLRTNYIVYHRNKFLTASARALMDALRRAAAGSFSQT